jgi:hypothetical protein
MKANLTDIRRNALALALVLTAANFTASVVLLHESHLLREQAAQCVKEVHGAMNPMPPTPPVIGANS